MHLAFVLPPFEIYAPERGLALAIITYEVTRRLEASGATVSVITPSDGDRLYDAGRVVALAFDPTGRSSPWERIRRKAERWDTPRYSSYLRELRRALDSIEDPPTAVVVFNDLVTGGIVERKCRQSTFTWLQNEMGTTHRSGLANLSRTHGVLAVSSYIADRSRERFGASAPPITVLPNGVDAERFRPLEGVPARAQGSPVRACFVGRIDPNKGPLLAARAVERCRAAGVEVELDVAGPVLAWGQEASDVDAYVTELRGVLARIGGTWCGHVTRDELPDFYRRYDVAFVPSVSPEPFGLVALEAMASGCAVIASDRGGLPEVCGDAALLVDPEDDEAFDAALSSLAADEPTLDAYRQDGRAHAEAHTWDVTARRLVEIVETLG